MRSSMTPPLSLSMQLYSALPGPGELGDVVGEQARRRTRATRGAARIDHAHVRHVEDAGVAAHRVVLFDLRAVVDRHVPAAEIDHARAVLDMQVIKTVCVCPRTSPRHTACQKKGGGKWHPIKKARWKRGMTPLLRRPSVLEPERSGPHCSRAPHPFGGWRLSYTEGPSLSRTRLRTLPFFCLSVSGRKLAPSAPSLKRVSRTESGQLASGWHHSSPFPDGPAETFIQCAATLSVHSPYLQSQQCCPRVLREG